MEKFTERLRQGHPSGTIILKTSDETKKLADNINYLVDELQSKIKLANEEKSKLMTAFTSMTEGVLILNAEDKIEFVNQALSNILSEQYGDINGKTLMEAFRSVDLQKAFLEFKETRINVSSEITLGNIEPVILNVSISAVQGHPEEEKTMIVFHDVTRLKKLEKIRIDFVANVTHEIRTPLTAIIGYLETIKAGAINNIEETKKFIDIILKQAERLNRLVEDLLTISKIELNEIRFNFENVFLSNAMTNVISLVEKKATSKKITIENNVPEKLRPVRADRDRLTQILVNILDNAVKFTPESGKVIIAADETDAYSVVSIIDTGIGVPKDEIQRLGERFYRVDKTRSAIIGYLETIKAGAINNINETKKFIDIILKQAERLNRLVEDLLTISKIELNEIRFNFGNVFLSDIVTNVISIVEKKATSKKITIENDIPEKLPPVRADRDRLTQIFVNILDNAVKFTPESGKVIIAADETDAYSVVSIIDTGIGVPQDEIQRLGERFYRVDKTRSRDLGGTGLGLSIVKHLMIAHGGRMEIESQLGRGTKVSLFFPVVKV